MKGANTPVTTNKYCLKTLSPRKSSISFSHAHQNNPQRYPSDSRRSSVRHYFVHRHGCDTRGDRSLSKFSRSSKWRTSHSATSHSRNRLSLHIHGSQLLHRSEARTLSSYAIRDESGKRSIHCQSCGTSNGGKLVSTLVSDCTRYSCCSLCVGWGKMCDALSYTLPIKMRVDDHAQNGTEETPDGYK